MDKWLELIRGLIRPYISVTGWTAFLLVAVWAIIKYIDAALANQIAIGFIGMVGTIVGVWLGSRATKRKE